MTRRHGAVDLFAAARKPAGEPFVWLTAMGLALGVAMIAFLLLLILARGLDAFWPKRIVVLTLVENSQARIQNAPHLAGVITRKQEKIARVGQSIENARSSRSAQLEWQLFVGNKDRYGLSFKYVDVADIDQIEYPKNILKIERMEYGDAVGYPISLSSSDGQVAQADDDQFNRRLRKLVDQSRERWARIKHLEKKEIGLINHKMSVLRLKLKAFDRSGAETPEVQARRQVIQNKIDELQSAYQELAAESLRLRGKQQQDNLTYRLATNETRMIPVGEVVDFYYPNQLSLAERVFFFLKNGYHFITNDPREANTEGGVFPALFGTFVMTVLMSLAVTPFGVLAAIYLHEYARQGMLVRSVRIAVNNLAGVPSIVFGVFGLGFFVYLVGGSTDSLFFETALPNPTFGTGGIIWASLTLALLTVPVVIVATEEALAAVPRSMREGSLACGASKWQTIQRIALPAAAPGILTGLILAMARGAGEVAPLMLVGVVKLAPNLPIDTIFPFVHLERKFMHLGFHIYDLGFQSPDSEAAKSMVFATTLLLISLVMILNLGAIVIRQHLRKKYALGAFS